MLHHAMPRPHPLPKVVAGAALANSRQDRAQQSEANIMARRKELEKERRRRVGNAGGKSISKTDLPLLC